MDQLLFVKYNSSRCPAYRLVTEIRANDKGKYIIKRAENSAAVPHVQKMLENRDKLKESYRTVRVIPAENMGEKICFPFISGKSLITELEGKKPDKESFVSFINQAFSLFFDVKDSSKRSFVPTDAFREVFGNVFPSECEAICPANIDSAFGNFIRNEDGLFCIDYEWVYDFPVPVDYIKYRSLIYLFQQITYSFLNDVTLEEFLCWFGLNRDKCDIFKAMENCFQQHVHGEGWKYYYLPKYMKPVISLQAAMERMDYQEEAITEKEQHIQDQGKIIYDKEVHIQNQAKAIEDKERHIQDQDKIIYDKEVHIQNQAKIIEDKERHIQDQDKIIYDKEVHIQNQAKIIEDKERHIQDQNKIIYDKEVHIQNQAKIIEDKERHIQDQDKIIYDKEVHIQNQAKIIEDKERHIQDQDKIIYDKEIHIQDVERDLADRNESIRLLNVQIQDLDRRYQEISNAFYWRMTKPLRIAGTYAKKLLKR